MNTHEYSSPPRTNLRTARQIRLPDHRISSLRQPNSPTAQQPNSPTAQQPNSPTAHHPMRFSDRIHLPDHQFTSARIIPTVYRLPKLGTHILRPESSPAPLAVVPVDAATHAVKGAATAAHDQRFLPRSRPFLGFHSIASRRSASLLLIKCTRCRAGRPTGQSGRAQAGQSSRSPSNPKSFSTCPHRHRISRLY